MSIKILVIDDNVSLLNMIKKILSRNRWKVFTAETGKDGLRIAKRKKPNLIVLDVGLPDMDGYKLCGLLKEEKKTVRIPILLLTAKTLLKDVEQGFKVSADGYLCKPFDPERLITKIKDML